MPPASAKAIASLIWRRSKYFSRIGADGTVSAQGARSLGVFRPEMKVTRGDPGRRVQHTTLDRHVVRHDVDRLAPPQVEQDQPWIAASRQQTASRSQPVAPQLERVRLEERVVEAGVGREIDQGYFALHLADPVDHSLHSRAADRHVEASLDGQRSGAREW